MQRGDFEIFKTSSGTDIQVVLDTDTVWLDAHLIAKLFDVKRPAIVKHIQKIYSTGELEELSTCSILEQVAADGKIRKMNVYNLDVIISVGYRVNSMQATQFRQWATHRLKEYLVEGASINQRRLEELQQTIQIISVTVNTETLELDEAKGLLNIIKSYSNSFDLLNRFDSNELLAKSLCEDVINGIDYLEARTAIDELKRQLIRKKEATEYFGNEKDEGFKSTLQTISQTFGGTLLYPSVEEQAAQ